MVKKKKKVEVKDLPFSARIESCLAEINPITEKWGIAIGAEPFIENGIIKANVKGYDRYSQKA